MCARPVLRVPRAEKNAAGALHMHNLSRSRSSARVIILYVPAALAHSRILCTRGLFIRSSTCCRELSREPVWRSPEGGSRRPTLTIIGFMTVCSKLCNYHATPTASTSTGLIFVDDIICSSINRENFIFSISNTKR